jgi:hypothetical protein
MDNTKAPLSPDGRPHVEIAATRPTVNVDQIVAAAQGPIPQETQLVINQPPAGALASISAMMGKR